MATINTGYKRSLNITVTKYINGILEDGYPLDYNGQNEFTYGGTTYPTLTGEQFALLSAEDYSERLTVYKAYVANAESIVSLDPYIVTGAEAIIYDRSTCPAPGDT